jgi:DNA-binding transcriptional regulator GbsR (MarR family)
MTARVLAALLFTEQPAMTAGDLGARLQASSGAISGAVKMLTSVGLVERVPAPASRRDHYRLRDSLARQRLTQMRDFSNFLFEEIPPLLDRWYKRQSSTMT